MKFLFDFFPVILFFIAFKVADIYVATGVAIAASFVQVAWLKIRGKRVEPMVWASLAIIAVFGGATLLLEDKIFIKWKPTVLYWLFGAVLAGAFVARRNLIRLMLSNQMQLPEHMWSRLNWSWIAFFVLMGVLNLYVAFPFSERYCAGVMDLAAKAYCEDNVWVNFKLFGGMGLMLLFVLAQALVLSRFVEEKDERRGENP